MVEQSSNSNRYLSRRKYIQSYFEKSFNCGYNGCGCCFNVCDLLLSRHIEEYDIWHGNKKNLRLDYLYRFSAIH